MKDKNELIIHIMHGYDSLETPDGTKCFGVYLKGKNEIYVASDIPDNQLFHTIAHEYCHYLQELRNREFDEEEADTYANMLFDTEDHDKQIREEVIEVITDKIIYPLLDECDRGLWEHISHIDLAKEWIKVLDDNPYPKVKNYTEARKKELRQWIAEQLKEHNNE